MSKAGRVALWVTGVMAALCAMAVLWFAAMMSGGFDDLFSGEGPKTTDEKVVAVNERAQEENQRELRSMEERHVRPALGPTSQVLATARTSRCETGQHNWKVDDSYDLRCQVSDAVMVTGRTAGLREEVLALHRSIVSDQRWAGAQSMPLSRVVGEYWDKRASFGADRPYSPSSLPQADYRSTGSDLVLHIRWADSRSRDLSLSAFGSQVRWSSTEGAPLTAAEVLRLIPAGDRYALIVELERQSFEE